MSRLTGMDFTRYGFHTQHTVHGFDLTTEFSPETLFKVHDTRDTATVHVTAAGLRQLYEDRMDADTFLNILDQVSVEVGAYNLLSEQLALFLYLINQVRVRGSKLTRENVAQLTMLPVSFDKKIHALHVAANEDVYHVIKAAELDSAAYNTWCREFDSTEPQTYRATVND